MNKNKNKSSGSGIQGVLTLITFLSLFAMGFEYFILFSNPHLIKNNTVAEMELAEEGEENKKTTDKKTEQGKEKEEDTEKSAKKVTKKSNIKTPAWVLIPFKIFLKYGVYIKLCFIICYILAMASVVEALERNNTFRISLALSLAGTIILFGGALAVLLFYKPLPKEGFAFLRLPIWSFIPSLLILLLGGFLVSSFFTSFFSTTLQASGLPALVDNKRIGNVQSVVVGVDEKGFPRREERDIAINIRTANGWINVVDSNRGVFILGGPGAGKSYSLVNPMIKSWVAKGFCGLVYDYKFPTLSDEVHKAFYYYKRQKDNYKFYLLNFSDMFRSHRCNPLKPSLIPDSLRASTYAETIIKNLTKERNDGNYFDESKTSLLRAIIWFLKKKHPEYCTLPHVIAMANYKDSNHMISAISSDRECEMMITDILNALENQAKEQLAGVIGSLTVSMGKLVSETVFWLLTGDDFDLAINDPKNPKWIVVGNNGAAGDALAPIIATVMNVAINLANQKNKVPCMIMVDEAPTVNIPGFDNLPNTGRSNHIVTGFCAQDFSQMDSRMGQDGRKKMEAALGNHFYGQTSSQDTGEKMVDVLGKEEIVQESESVSTSKNDGKSSTSRSTSYSKHKEDIITLQQTMVMPVGTFLGKTTKRTFMDSIAVPEDKQSFTIDKFAFLDVEKQLMEDYKKEHQLADISLEQEDEIRELVQDSLYKEISQLMQANFDKVLNDTRIIVNTYTNKFADK